MFALEVVFKFVMAHFNMKLSFLILVANMDPLFVGIQPSHETMEEWAYRLTETNEHG